MKVSEYLKYKRKTAGILQKIEKSSLYKTKTKILYIDINQRKKIGCGCTKANDLVCSQE